MCVKLLVCLSFFSAESLWHRLAVIEPKERFMQMSHARSVVYNMVCTWSQYCACEGHHIMRRFCIWIFVQEMPCLPVRWNLFRRTEHFSLDDFPEATEDPPLWLVQDLNSVYCSSERVRLITSAPWQFVLRGCNSELLCCHMIWWTMTVNCDSLQ